MPVLQTQALFSVVTSFGQNLCKTFYEENGSIESIGQTQLLEGEVETHAVSSLEQFNDLLNTLTHNQAIILGVADPTIGAKFRIVSKQTFDSLPDKTGTITRSLEFFRFHPCPGIILYDIDTKWKEFAPEHVKRLDWATFLVDFLNIPHALVRGSSSSRVKDSKGDMHLFTLAENAIDIPKIVQEQYQKLIAEGFGWAVLDNPKSRPCRVLIRTIIDNTVKSPERLVYEAAPIVHPPLALKPATAYTFGTHNEAQAYTPLTSPEVVAFSYAEKTLRANIEPLRIQRTAHILQSHTESEIIRRAGPNPPPEVADKIRLETNQAFNVSEHLAIGAHLVYPDKLGPSTVTDIIISDYCSRIRGQIPVFHEQTCADPFEPSYGASPDRIGRGKAKIYTDENPMIHSFAHGGYTVQLRLSPSDLISSLQRAKVENWAIELVSQLLYLLWRTTHFKEYEKPDARNKIIGLFEDKQTKTTIKEVIKSADKAPLPEPTEAVSQYGELASLLPEPIYLAEYYSNLYPDKIMFTAAGSWYRFADGWKAIKGDISIISEIRDLQHSLAEFHPKQAAKIRDESFARKTVFFTRSSVINADTVGFDEENTLMQAKNSITDYSIPAIRAKQKNDYCLMQTGYDPIPGPTPWWDKFLENIFTEDPCLITDFEYCLARSIYPGLGKHILFFVGPTNSGKSTILWVLHEIFGTYATPIEADLLLKNSSKPEERLFAVVGKKRLGVCGELPSNAVLDTGRLKRMTGGDILPSRELYKEQTSVVSNISLMIASNSFPKLEKADKAFADRWIQVELQNSFIPVNGRMPDASTREYPEIPHLRKKLEKELPHIFFKLQQISFSTMDDVFHVPDTFRIGMEEMDTRDPLIMWAKECVRITKQRGIEIRDYELFTDIHASLKTWCVINHVRFTPSIHELQRFLSDHGAQQFQKYDKLIKEDGKIITCGNTQGGVWLDGKMLKPRKNIRLINVFAVGDTTPERATDEPEAPGGQRTW